MPQPHSLSPSPLSKAEGSAFCLSSWPGLNAWQLLVPGRGQCTQPRGAQADGPAVPVRTWTVGQHRASGRAAWCVPLCPLPHQLALQGQAAGSQPTGKSLARGCLKEHGEREKVPRPVEAAAVTTSAAHPCHCSVCTASFHSSVTCACTAPQNLSSRGFCFSSWQ